jgi:hypothetical protein
MIGKAKEIIRFLIEQDDNKIFEIKEVHKKRSLTANAYAWKLITELGNVLRKSKEEVYLEMLKDYGQSIIISLNSEVDINHYFKYYDLIGTGIVNNKVFNHYKIYKGSSEYDSKEMSIFIDGIVQACEQVGIPTLTKEEIERMRLK